MSLDETDVVKHADKGFLSKMKHFLMTSSEKRTYSWPDSILFARQQFVQSVGQ